MYRSFTYFVKFFPNNTTFWDAIANNFLFVFHLQTDFGQYIKKQFFLYIDLVSCVHVFFSIT